MAENYEIVTSRAATVLAGTGDTVDVVETWIRALPSGVVYPYRLPDFYFTTDRIASAADLSANVIDYAWGLNGVRAMAHAQEVNDAGAIFDTIEVYVESDNQALSERLRFPLDLFAPPFTIYGTRGGGGGGTRLPGAVAAPMIEPPTWIPRFAQIHDPIVAAVDRLNATAGL